jgi:tetratricopeptide (TPR) repeat protein
MRTGDYNAAAHRNVVAAEADRAYIQATGAQGVYPLMYYSHNLHFLAAAAMEAGRYADARRAGEQLMGNIGAAMKGMPMLEFFGLMPTFVQVRFAHWKEILAVPPPDESMHLLNSFWHYSRGLSFLGTGDLTKAQAERDAFAASAAQVSPQTTVGGVVPESANKILKLAADVLDARLAESRGDRKSAIVSWRQAVIIQDTLAYDEPPIWYYSVRESLGAALLRDGQAAEAQKVFREDLDRHPRSGRALFGLWQCLKAQNKLAEAAWLQSEFEAAWKSADVSLSLDDL